MITARPFHFVLILTLLAGAAATGEARTADGVADQPGSGEAADAGGRLHDRSPEEHAVPAYSAALPPLHLSGDVRPASARRSAGPHGGTAASLVRPSADAAAADSGAGAALRLRSGALSSFATSLPPPSGAS